MHYKSYIKWKIVPYSSIFLGIFSGTYTIYSETYFGLITFILPLITREILHIGLYCLSFFIGIYVSDINYKNHINGYEISHSGYVISTMKKQFGQDIILIGNDNKKYLIETSDTYPYKPGDYMKFSGYISYLTDSYTPGSYSIKHIISNEVDQLVNADEIYLIKDYEKNNNGENIIEDFNDLSYYHRVILFINLLRYKVQQIIYFHAEKYYDVLDLFIVGRLHQFDYDKYTSLKNLGILHIIAISGLHMNIVMTITSAMFLYACLRVGIRAYFAYIFASISCVFYLFFSGIPISGVRALFSVIYAMIFRAFGMANSMQIPIFLSGIFILLFSPWNSISPSFHFTMFVVLGLAAALQNVFSGKIKNPIKVYVHISLVILSITIPISAFHFQEYTPMALIGNTFAVPFAFIIMVSTSIGILISPLSDYTTIALIPFYISQALIGIIDWIGNTFGFMAYCSAPSYTIPIVALITCLYLYKDWLFKYSKYFMTGFVIFIAICTFKLDMIDYKYNYINTGKNLLAWNQEKNQYIHYGRNNYAYKSWKKKFDNIENIKCQDVCYYQLNDDIKFIIKNNRGHYIIKSILET